MTDTNITRLVELPALVRMASPDGSFRLGGIFTPQNEHPLMVPSLLYWLDARLADGDNRVLGYVVIVIAAVILLLLRTALPKTLPPLVRAGLVVAMSGLIFSLQGMQVAGRVAHRRARQRQLRHGVRALAGAGPAGDAAQRAPGPPDRAAGVCLPTWVSR